MTNGLPALFSVEPIEFNLFTIKTVYLLIRFELVQSNDDWNIIRIKKKTDLLPLRYQFGTFLQPLSLACAFLKTNFSYCETNIVLDSVLYF